MKTVFVGLSGGVDSSVSALLLKEQGYHVVGVYMKNWSQDLPGFQCPWFDDYQDAKRIAVQLGIAFEVFDFEKDYKKQVFDYMLEEYKIGRTPNPDIMCNQEIKFKLFLDASLQRGADVIATGHYANTSGGKLYKSTDVKKDQTYFLYRVTKDALDKTIFPLGHLHKTEIRKIAAAHKLITATKKDSMGICFVGSVGIKEFLSQYVTALPGQIIDQHGLEVGEHDGAIFYTIGQRHGLKTGGGKPYYVTHKNMETNTVYVTTKLNDDRLWRDEFSLYSPHWINEVPESTANLTVRLRHGGKLLPVKSLAITDREVKVELFDKERALAPGQSAVLYAETEVLGGGIVV